MPPAASRVLIVGGGIGGLSSAIGLTANGIEVDVVEQNPIETVWVQPPWQRGRVTLLGDAAHATSPHVGQGAAMALEDSVVLAEELAGTDDLQAAFGAFGRRRYERVRTIVEISEQIAQWEIERDREADFIGLTMKSVMVTAEPI